MFDKLTTMEAAALFEKLIDAAEASGAYYPSDAFATEGTLGHELHELRVEVREVFLRKFFEVNPDRYVPLYGPVD